jgi:hypothetical protein
MACLSRRCLPLLLLALLVCGVGASRGTACPFCAMQGKTLLDEVKGASMVLYGTFANADEAKEQTDLVVEAVIKDHRVRGKRKVVTVGRYVPPAPDGKKYKYLVFCEEFKGKIDPYRGVAVAPGSKMPKYLKGALAVQDKPIGKRLRFFFDYLDDADVEVSNDAYKEFANADYKDYQAMAKDLPARRIIGWLKDPNTPAFRFGLYASMLGHCGKPKDAAVLEGLLADPDRRAASGVDGILAGYVMLDAKGGWKYVQGVLRDTRHEFMFRYAALRAVRFLYEFRPDLVSRQNLVDGVCRLLTQDDIADLAIEDLRKWSCWDKTDRILAVCKTPAYKLPIVRRAILRYCLSCKGNARAAAYVAEKRKEDAEAVKEAEELLKLEQETPPAPGTPPEKK